MFVHFTKSNRRLRWSLCLLLMMLVFPVLVTAQQDTAMQTLARGVSVTSSLAAGELRVFTFEANAGDSIDLRVTNEVGLALTVVLTDMSGGLIFQGRDAAATGVVDLQDVTLGLNGTYYATVFPIAGVNPSAAGDFQITLDPDAAQPAPTAVAEQPILSTGQFIDSSGIQIRLTWNAAADLGLEVRDPVGGALFFNNTMVQSGGVFGLNVNQNCESAVSSGATEQATWAPGQIPTGSYEVIVYYYQDCQNLNTPVPFAVDVTVNGEALPPVNGTLLPNQVFISSFVIGNDGAAQSTGLTGIKGDDTLPASAGEIIARAQPITPGTIVQGLLTNQQPYLSYSFNALRGDTVNAVMTSTSGSLDTYVVLLDPLGNIIDANDDSAQGVTNSALSNVILPADGTYILVASRYGLRIGGTEGGFDLSLTVATSGATPVPQIAVATPIEGATGLPPAPTPQLTGLTIPPELIALQLPQGSIEIYLTWSTFADLQLLVRDPIGDAVFDDIPQIRSGGRLGAAGNVGCRALAEGTTPVSYVYWPANITPRAGAYEIDVWFQSECNDPTPVVFNLYVRVGGQVIFAGSAEPLLDEHYVASFTIDPSGVVFPGEGGVTGLNTLDWRTQLETAVPLVPDTPVSGNIAADNKFDLYLFSGLEGDVVTVDMRAAANTTLDTKLYLIAPDGSVAAENDDAVAGENTNSLINNFTLPEDGQYIIIATHYGERFGVSSGNYTLTLEQTS